jgi:hypothetical protein
VDGGNACGIGWVGERGHGKGAKEGVGRGETLHVPLDALFFNGDNGACGWGEVKGVDVGWGL